MLNNPLEKSHPNKKSNGRPQKQCFYDSMCTQLRHRCSLRLHNQNHMDIFSSFKSSSSHLVFVCYWFSFHISSFLHTIGNPIFAQINDQCTEFRHGEGFYFVFLACNKRRTSRVYLSFSSAFRYVYIRQVFWFF